MDYYDEINAEYYRSKDDLPYQNYITVTRLHMQFLYVSILLQLNYLYPSVMQQNLFTFTVRLLSLT